MYIGIIFFKIHSEGYKFILKNIILKLGFIISMI